MRLLILLLTALVVLAASACASVPATGQGWIEPPEAIRGANEAPGRGMHGEFVLTVRNLDSYPDQSYLNSEKDYRDQRNLTIRMHTSIVPRLEKHLGVKFQELRGRRLVVRGIARRIRIDFADEAGKRTGKYYYQTHVEVFSPAQVRFVD